MNENTENKKPKKKFKLEAFPSMMMGGIMFMVGQETGSVANTIEGFSIDRAISIAAYVAAVLLFFLGVRAVWNNRRDQLLAQIEAEEKAAREAAEKAAAEAEKADDDEEYDESEEDTDTSEEAEEE